MKLTKLKKYIKEEIQKLNEIETEKELDKEISTYQELSEKIKKKRSEIQHDDMKVVKESLSKDWWKDTLKEAKCGVGQNPADTGCTPENPSTTKPKFKMPKFKMPKIKTLADMEKKRKERKRKRDRPDRKPNIVNGVDVIKDKKDEQHFIDDFHLKGDKGVDQYEYDKKMQDQYAKQVKKLTPKQRKQQRKDILSWKQLGGYEAIERAVADGTHTREEIRERNERISEVSHNTVTNVDRPIERGISVPAEAADQILKDFVIGEMVEIPDEAGHGSSGFSTSADTARGFARVDDPDSEQTSILFRIKPNSNGQVRGVFIDGESDEDGGHWGEAEITRSSKSKAKVMTVETKKLPSGKIVKIITLQEPDDLSEVVVREEKEKENILSKKYLEGPLNPKARLPKIKKKKVKESLTKNWWKETIQENKLKEIIREEIQNLNEGDSKTVLVDKGGFGEFSLFDKKSTKDELIGQRGLSGDFLDDLGIAYEVGDVVKIKAPVKHGNAFKLYKVKIYKISNKHYHGKFI